MRYMRGSRVTASGCGTTIFWRKISAKGITEAHKLGKKFFLAANVIPHNAKIKTFMKD